MKAYQEEIEIHKQDETLLRQALEALQWEHARTLVLLEIHKQDETLLRQALEVLESCAVLIDSEWGSCRSLDEMQESGDYPSLVREPIRSLRERLGETT